MGKNNLNSYCFDFSFEKSKTIDEKELSDFFIYKTMLLHCFKRIKSLKVKTLGLQRQIKENDAFFEMCIVQ